ncbi:RsmB/NOP family class I SAM-dependent RNA methyltransferase [Aureimonas leprariae]|uniref:RsmB/NOP family class I SAM-dependent RNA methyltransferase n=1 Tax=Plantimonas leprariae TaxID=2615207 RepID=A0A7V7TUV8_9HYPH|nr:RsmB/NOP family class I SAM-dependent RNA methyltransferase [Aureimonas leprariae]KAB0676428.1 RsmB/NOP family class I SAM-dependent RNA methyltransferase [Aureimonas leprariae]
MRLGGRLAAAVEVLDDVAKRHRPVADALKDWGLSHRFAGSGDRSAIGNLVYDALRRRRSFGWRMGNDSPRALVFAALAEGYGMAADAVAAALEGDRFAPKLPSAADFERFRTVDLAKAPDAVRADVPDWLADEFAISLGPEWIAEAAAFAERPPLDLRVNALLGNREEAAAKLAEFGAAATRLSPLGLRIPPIAGAGRHPNVQAEAVFQMGTVEVQDEGSQLVSLLVGAKAGETILDFCAGAGGKTLALAAATAGERRIHAFDADRRRLAPIYERLRRARAESVEVHSRTGELEALEGACDRVLVDAPCTGSGTWRRRPDAKWRLSRSALEKRTAEQDAVLDSAARFVRPGGGRLAYVTCSVLASENGARVEAFLARHPDFAVEDAGAVWREELSDVPPDFLNVPGGGGSGLLLTARRSGTDGFFFARLVRR